MPGMDGFQVAEHLRRQPGGCDAIILMLTSDDLNPKLARGRELGLDAYVVKPIKRSELLDVIAAVMNKANLSKAKVAEAARPPAPVRPADVQSRALRILLADDSPDNRILIQAYLKNSHYVLDTAENAEAAFAKFTSGRYDAVLMDVQMPVMDGYTAVRKIRQWEREHNLKPTPIIALTASALEDGVRRSLEAGCTAHLSKPVKKSSVLDALGQVTGAGPSANGLDATENRIVVEGDPDLKDLIPEFLAHKRQDLTLIRAAFERRDYAALATFGHRMKGEGGGFGLGALSEMGDAIERAANAGRGDEVGRQVQALSDYLGRVKVVFPDRAIAAEA
jgi:CheY-like chemotaxis protein